jgi:hypothetical protein
MVAAGLTAVAVMSYAADHPTSWAAQLIGHAATARPIPATKTTTVANPNMTPVDQPPVPLPPVQLPDNLLSPELTASVRELEILVGMTRTQPPDFFGPALVIDSYVVRGTEPTEAEVIPVAPVQLDDVIERIPVEPFSPDEPLTIEILPVAPKLVEDLEVTPEGLLEIIPFLHEPMDYQWQIYPETRASGSGWWRFLNVIEYTFNFTFNPLARLFYFEEQYACEPVANGCFVPVQHCVPLHRSDWVGGCHMGCGLHGGAVQRIGIAVDWVAVPEVVRGSAGIVPPSPCPPVCRDRCGDLPCCKEKMVRKVYPVRHLVKGDEQANADCLINVLLQTVEPKSWVDNGGEAGVEYFPRGKCLVVNHTPSMHEEIAKLLQDLHKAATECDEAEAVEASKASRLRVGEFHPHGTVIIRDRILRTQACEECRDPKAWFEQFMPVPVHFLPVVDPWQRWATPENIPTPVEIEIDFVAPHFFKFFPKVEELKVLPISVPSQLPECPEDEHPNILPLPSSPHGHDCTRYLHPYTRNPREVPATPKQAPKSAPVEPTPTPGSDRSRSEECWRWLEGTELLETEELEVELPADPLIGC